MNQDQIRELRDEVDSNKESAEQVAEAVSERISELQEIERKGRDLYHLLDSYRDALHGVANCMDEVEGLVDKAENLGVSI